MSLLNLTGEVIAMGDANAEDLAAIDGKPRLLIKLADDQVVMVAGLTREQVRAVAPAFLEVVSLAVSQ